MTELEQHTAMVVSAVSVVKPPDTSGK